MTKTAQLIARIQQVQLRGNTAPRDSELLQEIIEHLRELDATPRPAAPAGWQSVPVEPTQAEIDAGINELCATDLLQEGYANVIKRIRKAMLAAAQPAGDGGEL